MKIKSKKRISFRIGCIIVITLLTVFALNACYGDNLARIVSVLEERWGIDLPDDIAVEYRKTDEPTFINDGVGYTVFKLETEPTDFISDFSREKNKDFETIVNMLIFTESVNIDKNFSPDWEAEYFWKFMGRDSSSEPFSNTIHYYYDEENDAHNIDYYFHNLYMIYFPNSLKLIVCEFLI